MLEATQLKAVRTVVEILRDDPGVVEVQVVGIAARSGRRPTEPVDADVIQRTVVRVATAPLVPAPGENVRAAIRFALPTGVRRADERLGGLR